MRLFDRKKYDFTNGMILHISYLLVAYIFESDKFIRSRNMHFVQHYRRYWRDLKRYKRAKALPAAGWESVLRSMHIFTDARVLVFTQGQDDSYIRLIIFFYGSRYRHIVKRRWNVQGRIYACKKKNMICTMSLNATFRIISSASRPIV